VIFNPLTQRKVDIRSTGAMHAWRVSSIGLGKFSLSGLEIEYQVTGLR
jgi:hypothetical protein